MEGIFVTILNMSLTGAFVVAAILIARLPLKKAPKIISYCLWAVAGFRLLIPFSIESAMSLLPFRATLFQPSPMQPASIQPESAAPVPVDIAPAMYPQPYTVFAPYDAGSEAVQYADSAVQYADAVTPIISEAISIAAYTASQAAGSSSQLLVSIGAYVWLIGVAIMLGFGILSLFRLKKAVKSASLTAKGIYECESAKSPFVLGFFRPKIYIPPGLSVAERTYVIIHERTHIRRRDHIIKLISYFILCLHWFNPMVWVAFLFLSADMEMACDESVLKEMGGQNIKDYSMSLLRLSANQPALSGSPLAFSEGGLKVRIKNVLKFQKQSRLIAAAAVAFAIILGVGLAMNPTAAEEYNRYEPYAANGEAGGFDEYYEAEAYAESLYYADTPAPQEQQPNTRTWYNLSRPLVTSVNIEWLQRMPYLESLTIFSYRHDGVENSYLDLSALRYLPNLISLEIRCNQTFDLAHLAYLPNLNRLELYNENISDISALANLQSLESFGIFSSRLRDISPLAELPSLQDIQIGGTNSSFSDISPLAGHPSLRYLYLWGGHVSDISALQGMTNLELFVDHSGSVSDISPLFGLTGLRRLDLHSNGDLDGDSVMSIISELTNLEMLSLGGFHINDISPLANLVNLEFLNLFNLGIADISPLADLTKLFKLVLGDNQISDISPLSGLSNLRFLGLAEDSLSDLSALFGLINLENIALGPGPLKSAEQISELREVLPNADIMIIRRS